MDRVSHLTVTEELAGKQPTDFAISDYFGQTFSMYLGEETEVELLCENALVSSIIDHSEEEVCAQIVDREHFKVTATIDLSNNFYGWVFVSGGKMRILDPKSVLEQFNNILNSYST